MKNIIETIKGDYKVCGVIGNPIEHTLSPFIHNTIAQMVGTTMVYVPFKVEEEQLMGAIDGAHALGILGLNVTMPHKQQVIEHVLKLDSSAKAVGAVNTLIYEEAGYVGYNTDVYGLQTAIEEVGFDYKNKNIAIIGSGGAAYAAVVALKDARCIHIYNRTLEKANALKIHVQTILPSLEIEVFTMDADVRDEYALVVQTTGVGMGNLKNKIPSCGEQLLAHASCVVDMIYNPKETLFLKHARQKGCQTMNGFGMLFYQAVKAYELMHKITLSKQAILEIKKQIEEVLSD